MSEPSWLPRGEPRGEPVRRHRRLLGGSDASTSGTPTRPLPQADADGYVPVARLADLKPGQPYLVYIESDPYVLIQLDGEFLAVDGVCPDRAGPLGEGFVDGCRIYCPWHYWGFNLRTGWAEDPPVKFRVPCYPVRIEDDIVYLGRQPL